MAPSRKDLAMDDFQALRDEFLEWSGGFEPEGEHQITVFIDYAMTPGINEEVARAYLLGWSREGCSHG
jgi:hypothetical protein